MEGEEGRKGKEALSGGHLCHVCGYQYPNANPSAKLRRSHRKNCGKAPAADEREEGEEADAAMERNAGEGLLPGTVYIWCASPWIGLSRVLGFLMVSRVRVHCS